MRLNLNTTSKYLEEVDTLDELEANTLKWKHGIRLWVRMYTHNLTLDISPLKTHPGRVPRGLSRFMIDYNNSLVTIRITETKIFNAN